MTTISINNPYYFAYTCENTLKRVEDAQTEAARKAILSRQTVQGLKWAIEFVNGLKTDNMNEAELNHAIRLTYFRGANCPVYHN